MFWCLNPDITRWIMCLKRRKNWHIYWLLMKQWHHTGHFNLHFTFIEWMPNLYGCKIKIIANKDTYFHKIHLCRRTEELKWSILLKEKCTLFTQEDLGLSKPFTIVEITLLLYDNLESDQHVVVIDCWFEDLDLSTKLWKKGIHTVLKCKSN